MDSLKNGTKASDFLHLIRNSLEAASDPQTAREQAKYMRNQFAFFGCKSPVWKGIVKDAIKEKGLLTGEDLAAFVRICFADPHREMQYAGLFMLERRIKKEPGEAIALLEECIRTKSWWDTVDWTAKLVGWHFSRFPELQYPTSEKWMDSGEIWLQRVAIIHQLTYREKTDETLLYDLILRVADSREFFLQKASGWALRNYARTNPGSVEEFIAAHTLSPLTVREGMRLIRAGKAK
jgi:3-methyladenine DNA glycosylase AlkD